MSVPTHKRTSSTEQPSSRQNSHRQRAPHVEGEGSGLGEIKQMGKKVLRKLIHNQPMGTIKRLAKKGVDKFILNPKLLPELTFQSMSAGMSQKQPPSASQFQAVNLQLTQSMLSFHENVTSQHQEEGDLLRLQTQKCYRHIPQAYFKQTMPMETFDSLLTRNPIMMSEKVYELGDLYDEVEFNVNQQVDYKLKVFINFVSFLTDIGNLANLSISKIRAVRTKNHTIKQLIVHRVDRVNILRRRKEAIEHSLQLLQQLKILKRLEEHLMGQVQLRGKISMSDTSSRFSQYCEAHQRLKQYCCPRLLCRFWDVSYNVKLGYQDSFTRALTHYLTEIIVFQEKGLAQIVRPNRQTYTSVGQTRGEEVLSRLKLDESYELEEEEIQLVTKHNIEKEIVGVFQHGLDRCNYDTDGVCKAVTDHLSACFHNLFLVLKGEKAEEGEEIPEKDRKKLLDKLPMSKFVRVVALWSSRLKKILQRQCSVLERTLKLLPQLRCDYPEKEQVLASQQLQIFIETMKEADRSLSFLLMNRKIVQQQVDFIRQLLQYGQEWRELVIDFKHYPSLWHYLKWQLIPETEQDGMVNSEHVICHQLLSSLTAARCKIMELMIDGYYQSSIDRVPQCLKDDTWMPTSIPVGFYNILGQVVYGQPFIRQRQKIEQKLLSSSLLLDKNSSVMMQIKDSEGHIQPQTDSSVIKADFNLHVTQRIVCLSGQKFKMFSSTIVMVEIIHGYLEWVEEVGEEEALQDPILSKIMEILIMYVKNVQGFILQKRALKESNSKSKTITGKHLLLVFSQLSFVRVLIDNVANRFPPFKDKAFIIHKILSQTMQKMRKKFKDFIKLNIRQSIEHVVVDKTRPISGPLKESRSIVEVLLRSCELIRDNLMSEEDVGPFINVEWCRDYLTRVKDEYKKVYKYIMSSNSSRKAQDVDWSDNLYWKLKELNYIKQSLQPIGQHLPHFEDIVNALEDEKKKLDKPY